MWTILMAGCWGLGMAVWFSATAFVKSRGYQGNYMMQTGFFSNNPTLAALSSIRKEGRPVDRSRARWYRILLAGSVVAFAASFLLFLRSV